MIVTLDTSGSIVAVLATAVATTQPTYNYSGVNWSSDGSTSTADYSDGALNGVTEQTVVSAPASGFKQVDSIRIYNNDIASVVLTVSKAVGASRYPLGQWTVSPGAWVDVLTSTTAQGGTSQTENVMTATGTAVFGSINRVKSLGANATISIPTGATTGQLFDIAVDETIADYFVVLQDTGGAYIDYDNVNDVQTGRLFRNMWAGEWATLEWTGSYWHKKAGKTIPMSATLIANANQTFANSALTKLNYNTLKNINAPSNFASTASALINILRNGIYSISGVVLMNNTNTAINSVSMGAYCSASSTYYSLQGQYMPASIAGQSVLTSAVIFIPYAESIGLYLSYSAGTYTTSVYANIGGLWNSLSITEIPVW